MVQFRCGSKFTVLPTDGKNSDSQGVYNWESSVAMFLQIQTDIYPTYI